MVKAIEMMYVSNSLRYDVQWMLGYSKYILTLIYSDISRYQWLLQKLDICSFH